MKRGILGGTFDPPHLGHLALGLAVLEQLHLDEVLFIPAAKNPLKQTIKQTPPKRRLDMVKLLIADQPGLAVTDIELTRAGPSFAIDTVQELITLQPGEYWFIMGSDTMDTIQRWKAPDRLAKLCRFAVYMRPPHETLHDLKNVTELMASRIDVIEAPPMIVSSTMVRDHVERHKDVDNLIPESIKNYITQHHLYELD